MVLRSHRGDIGPTNQLCPSPKKLRKKGERRRGTIKMSYYGGGGGGPSFPKRRKKRKRKERKGGRKKFSLHNLVSKPCREKKGGEERRGQKCKNSPDLCFGRNKKLTNIKPRAARQMSDTGIPRFYCAEKKVILT